MSIMINFYLEDKSFLYYSLIKKSIELYKNILLEISFVRELIIMNSTYYNKAFYLDVLPNHPVPLSLGNFSSKFS